MTLDDNISALATAIGTEIKTKQDTLISGTNIATINNQSLLSGGNIVISGGDVINWIDYVTIKNLEDLGNGIIKYTDTNGSYYRKIIDSPYEDIIYADVTLTIELTRR